MLTVSDVAGSPASQMYYTSEGPVLHTVTYTPTVQVASSFGSTSSIRNIIPDNLTDNLYCTVIMY